MTEVWWDQVNSDLQPGGSIPPSLRHYNNRGVETSGAEPASDDRARRMTTRTTRKDKPDDEEEGNGR